MKKYFFLLAFILLIANVSAYTLARTLPYYIEPGEKFNVVYEIQNADDQMYVSWSDIVSGGCTPINITGAMTSSMMTKKVVEVTAPNNITECTFDGYFFFQDGVVKNFVKNSIQIGNLNTENNSVTTNSDTVVTNPQGILSNKASYCSYAEKLAFFDFFKNKCIEGTVIGALILYILFKLLK